MAHHFENLKIKNFEQMGKLIKTWALGVDRVKNGKKYLPRPASMKEFCDMMVNAKAATKPDISKWLKSFGGSLGAVRFVQSDRSTLYVRLPMADMLEYREEYIGGGGDYRVPDFYSTSFFDGKPQVIKDPKKGHNERVGDYVMAQCG